MTPSVLQTSCMLGSCRPHQRSQRWRADLLTPGRAEAEINEEIFELCASHFGTRKHWHKRLVRTGANTIHPIYVDTAGPDAASRRHCLH